MASWREQVAPDWAAALAPQEPQLTAIGAFLREEIAAHLARHRGNVSAVARAMGQHRRQVQRWIERFGLDAHDHKRP